MSNAPNPARKRAKPKPKPFDLDALDVEAMGTPFTFTFGGEEYELPVVADLAVGELLTDGDWSGAIRKMLGPGQWARVVASDAVLDMTRAIELVNAFTAHIGTTAGE